MYATTQVKTIAKQPPMGLHSARTHRKGIMSSEGKEKTAVPEVEKIKSRFGEVTVDASRAILFPVGLLGMPDKFHFVLTDFPNPKMEQFKLLQSLDDESLSFITLPVELENNIIAKADIEHACREMEIPPEDLGIVLIVSVHRSMTSVQLSVNARAPIFFDVERRAAAQYVFTSNKYKIQHFITGGDEGETATGAPKPE